MKTLKAKSVKSMFHIQEACRKKELQLLEKLEEIEKLTYSKIQGNQFLTTVVFFFKFNTYVGFKILNLLL